MRYRIVFLLLLGVQLCAAQVFTIETIKKGEGYEFPKVNSQQRPDIAKKINAVILTNLGANPNAPSPYDSIQFEDEYFFEVGGVNERLVCLVATGSHSGCGHHVTRHVMNFDSRTAKEVGIADLFGPNGEAKMKKVLIKLWVASIKEALKEESYQKEEYKECLIHAERTDDIYINRMLVMDQSIKFWAGSCLDGSNYEYDMTAGPHTLSFGQLLPMLTPYGYSLFVDKSTGPIKTLMRGTIDGKYPVSLSLLPGSSAGTVGGVIVYDRIGEPINVSGTLNGNQVVFHELDPKTNAELSTIEVSWDGAKLTGSFTNLKTKKQMPFVASVVK